MKSGYTTGSCAAAGTKAAILALQGNVVQEIELYALSGELLHIPIKNVELTSTGARAEVIKDAGDDPDITHGASVFTEVKINKDDDKINFYAGLGIGKSYRGRFVYSARRAGNKSRTTKNDDESRS